MDRGLEASPGPLPEEDEKFLLPYSRASSDFPPTCLSICHIAFSPAEHLSLSYLHLSRPYPKAASLRKSSQICLYTA